jgi:hypothetical protein
MSDELHVGEFTLTDADGNVHHGTHGVISGEGVTRLVTEARLLHVAIDAHGVTPAYEVLQSHNCRAEPHCTCDHNSWYHRDTDDEGMSGAAECGADGCSCTSYDRCHAFKP